MKIIGSISSVRIVVVIMLLMIISVSGCCVFELMLCDSVVGNRFSFVSMVVMMIGCRCSVVLFMVVFCMLFDCVN